MRDIAEEAKKPQKPVVLKNEFVYLTNYVGMNDQPRILFAYNPIQTFISPSPSIEWGMVEQDIGESLFATLNGNDFFDGKLSLEDDLKLRDYFVKELSSAPSQIRNNMPVTFVGQLAGGVYSYGANGYKDLGEIKSGSITLNVNFDPTLHNINAITGNIKFETTRGNKWDVDFGNTLPPMGNNFSSVATTSGVEGGIQGFFAYGGGTKWSAGGTFDLTRQNGNDTEKAVGVFVTGEKELTAL